MLFKRQKTDWVLFALVALGVCLYASYRPRFRLRAEMPPEFVDPDANAARKSAEQQIAQAYWKCLVDDVQWRYGYGHSLPGEAPVEFNLGMLGKTSVPEDQATRIRYWRRAQRFWYIRNAWSEEYEWSLDWTTDWLQTGGDWLHRRFQNLGGN
jgi:hypothetical protein